MVSTRSTTYSTAYSSGIDSPLGVPSVVPIDPRGDHLVRRRVRQEIAGDLLDRELIKRHVGVVGVDDPVTLSAT